MKQATKNSLILSTYMLLAFLYYLVGDVVRVLIYGLVLFISLYVSLRKNKITDTYTILKIPKSFFVSSLLLFFLTIVAVAISKNFSPFILYLLSSPLMAYFVYRSSFNVKILKYSYYIILVYFLFFFLTHRTLEGVFQGMSANYVSVVVMMNVVLIYLIQYRQEEKISYLPSILAFLFAVLAIGRSGILTTLGIVLTLFFVNWLKMSFGKKMLSSAIIITPIVILVALNWNTIILLIENISFFEKFINGGLESTGRSVLVNEYLRNMNSTTLLTGFNFYDNYYFEYYHFNPHNSYLRLHHYTGVSFFIIITAILVALYKLFRKHLFLSGLLFAILLRIATDSAMFLTIYDFVVVTLLMVAFFDKQTKRIY